MDEVMFVVETDCQNKYTELDVLQKFQELDADITAFKITRHKRGEYVALQERIAELEEDAAQIVAVTKMIMDEKCPSDEVHCTCVPVLREEIARLREKEKLYDKLVADLTTKA